jgi:hypothetical protein
MKISESVTNYEVALRVKLNIYKISKIISINNI